MIDATRRDFLRLALGAGAAFSVGCGARASTNQPASNVASPTGRTATVTSAPTPGMQPSFTPRATAPPVPPKSRIARSLLPGTPSETALIAGFSGNAGPVLMVLGGVHGNEPGGWLAADQVSRWEPTAGGLVVVPHANKVAEAGFERTTDALGDLNRLYPGSAESALPMERMAAAIVAAAREFRVDVLIDLHESWAFYADRQQNGTAYLGQTVTMGVGPRNPELGRSLVERANTAITVKRDLLIERDGAPFQRDAAPGATPPPRGRSSLAIGGYVDGLTPILVEMGQQDQPIERRTELHLLVVRSAMELLGIA